MHASDILYVPNDKFKAVMLQAMHLHRLCYEHSDLSRVITRRKICLKIQ